MDTLNAFTEENMQQFAKRFSGLSARMKVNYIVALGLEGFTVAEIESITKKPSEQVEALLVYAGVVKQ